MARTVVGYPAHSVQEKNGRLYCVFRFNKKQKWLTSNRIDNKENRKALDGGPGKYLVKSWIDLQGYQATKTTAELELARNPLADLTRVFIDEVYPAATTKVPTRRAIKRELGRLVELSPVKDVSEITREIYKGIWIAFESKYGTYEKGGKSYPMTTKAKHNVLMIFGKFFKWCFNHENKYITSIPTVDVKISLKDVEPAQVIWTQGEIETIIGRSGKYADLYKVLAYTGIYPADVWQLEKRHIVKELDGSLKIVKKRCKAKSSKEMIRQPISSKVLDVIKARLKNCVNGKDKLFPELNTYKDTESWGGTWSHLHSALWNRVFPGVDVKPSKALRHTFATFHASRGVPMNILREWMGHSGYSRVLEAVYTHLQTTAHHMD